MPSLIKMQQQEIAETYFPNPFHDWPHGRHVGNQVMFLEGVKDKVTPGRMAGYFHDADHKGFVQEDDEERAARIAHDMLTNWGFSRDFITQTKSDIIGTIFKNRGSLILPEQIRIADADLSKLGMDYIGFVQNSVKYLLETYEAGEITDDEIIRFFKEDQPKFFSYLTDISGRPETPFLSQMAQTQYPNFSKNRDTMAQQIEDYPHKFINAVREAESLEYIRKFRENLGNY